MSEGFGEEMITRRASMVRYFKPGHGHGVALQPGFTSQKEVLKIQACKILNSIL